MERSDIMEEANAQTNDIVGKAIECPNCRAENKAGAKFCSECGLPFRRQAKVKRSATPAPVVVYANPPMQKEEKSRIAAGVLALLLGGLGIHKFYLGEPGLGIIYLLFCWTAIPLIVGIIEGIIYLTTSDEAFQRRYVK
jgi:TM2 domain-containing membrane protein YozV